MEQKTPTVSISEAQAALSQMGNMARGLAKAEIIINALANADQVGRELETRIKAKRAEIAKLETATMDRANAKAKESAAAIIAEAQDGAREIIADAQKEADQIEKSLAAAKIELGNVENKIAGLKEQARALAG